MLNRCLYLLYKFLNIYCLLYLLTKKTEKCDNKFCFLYMGTTLISIVDLILYHVIKCNNTLSLNKESLRDLIISEGMDNESTVFCQNDSTQTFNVIYTNIVYHQNVNSLHLATNDNNRLTNLPSCSYPQKNLISRKL